MPEQLTTPIVLLTFNRPDTTQVVFDVIRKARPKQLFLITDGPRENVPDDDAKCKQVKDIISNVDWDCDVKTNFAETNMGLKDRVISGLNWCFEHVDKAIILEDDCVADMSFFPYCEELLTRYENDTRIMTISGNNFQLGKTAIPHSYYYSRYMHCWGWATWKRAWDLFDPKMTNWPELKQDKWLDYNITDTTERLYWEFIFDKTNAGEINSWAYQMVFSIWKQNGLNIIPTKNLVSNIGFGGDATNTTNTSTTANQNSFANMQTGAIDFPLAHPSNMVRHFIADDLYARLVTKPRRQFLW
ncbi:MAG: glycosyltransferase family 2 protein [Alphaproteobacteria bacterium]|nr:glycosyltransferase family 2 protein [Alphaproteobacteria bacterium]